MGCRRANVHRHVQVPPQHIPVPTRCFSHIHVDLVGPLPASKGFSYLFTIIDRTSPWPEAIPIAATSTVDCANALFQGWVSRFGVPAVITSDLWTQFTSSLWAALCSLLNIQHSQKRYCPARWIRPKLGSLDRPSFKREAGRFLEKSPPPHPPRALQSISIFKV